MIGDRATLPQLEHRPFLTDSGLETTLIFNEGVDLPSFAAFVLLETWDGRRRLRRYFERHAEIAREADCGSELGKLTLVSLARKRRIRPHRKAP